MLFGFAQSALTCCEITVCRNPKAGFRFNFDSRKLLTVSGERCASVADPIVRDVARFPARDSKFPQPGAVGRVITIDSGKDQCFGARRPRELSGRSPLREGLQALTSVQINEIEHGPAISVW